MLNDEAPTANQVNPEFYSLLAKLPGIEQFTPEQIHSLCNLFVEKKFLKNTVIVKERDPIKNIYLIVSGEVDIQKTENRIPEIVATLTTGDYIGMTSGGFFSHTGQRTATAIAHTDVTLLELSINDFDAFLFQNPELREKLTYADDLIIRLDFIRQLTIYANLNVDDIKNLAEKTTELVVEANTVIFQQDTKAEYCYFIRDGKVTISIEQDGQERKITELGRCEMFGETALITESERNATAQATTRCTLLRIDRNNFLDNILKNPTNSKIVAKLIHNRSRPEKIDGVSVHEMKTKDDHVLYILKNPVSGRYCRLSQEGLFIWQRLNGKNTLHDIMLAMFQEFHILNPFVTEGILLQLINSGFIKGYESEFFTRDTTHLLPWWMRGLIYLRKIMEFEYFFPSINDKLTRLYNKGFYLIFTKAGLAVVFLTAILGFFVFLSQFSHGLMMMKDSPALLGSLIIYIIPISIISIILHELGHAFTTKYYGRDVHQFGIGWLWLTTRVMTNTSDMWLCPQGPRIAVDLAGLITNCFLAGFSALIMYFVDSPRIDFFLWVFSFYTYLAVIQNLNPFYLLDGYYVLMDVFDNPNLRESAITWLTKLNFKNLFSLVTYREHKAEVTYWIFGISYILFSCILFYYIQKFIFGSLSFQVRHPLVAFLLPAVFFVLATISIWAEILRRKMHPLRFND